MATLCRGRFNGKAVGYRLKSGQQALARSAMTEGGAVAEGSGIAGDMPEIPARAAELDLQLALGRALMAARGFRAVVGDTSSGASAR